MTEGQWDIAVIDQREGRVARVAWDSKRRLPLELVPVARQLGYTESELARFWVGELTEDLAIGDEIYLRGALVMPDEDGYPAVLFGKPLIRREAASGLV